jgi:glycosyltransferase involved in cell wall biosynthesis
MRGIYRVVDSILPELSKQLANLSYTSTDNSILAIDYSLQKKIELLQSKSRLHKSISQCSEIVRKFHQSNIKDHDKNSHFSRKLSRRTSSIASDFLGRVASASSGFDLEGINIFHQPAPFRIPSFIRAHNRRDFVRFMTIYDFIPFMEGYGNRNESRYLQSVFNSLQPNDYAICISEYVKNEACERLKMNPENVFVAPLAASTDIFYPNDCEEAIKDIRLTYQLNDSPYFLSLCALDPRKNMRLLLQAFADLCLQQPEMKANLVLAGNASESTISKLKFYASELGIGPRLIMLGFVKDQYLSALYSGSIAFLFPSLAEGFGLPPLEAMQCGTPVISSSATSLTEVVGDCGILVDPTQKNEFTSAMWDLYNNDALRKELSIKGIQRAVQFSWNQCAQDHVSAYQTALS